MNSATHERTFTKEQFLSTTEPYEFLNLLRDNPLEREQAFVKTEANARSVGIKNFRWLLKAYQIAFRIAEHSDRNVEKVWCDSTRKEKRNEQTTNIPKLRIWRD